MASNEQRAPARPGARVAAWPRPDHLVLAFDLGATALFALEGATSAAVARFDLFGILVVAFVTALAGGMLRDVLIGAVPPAALEYKRYPIAALVGGLLVFAFAHQVREVHVGTIVALDAGGLSLFAMSGARKAMDYGLNGLTAVLMGVLTGVGGGVVRDLLLGFPPRVLTTDIYASAALLGATVMVLGVQRGQRAAPMMALGGAICFTIRMVAYWQHWSLPQAGF